MAGRTDLFVNTLPSNVSPSLELGGVGNPEGVVPGVPGQTYVDVQTLDLYLKIAGVQNLGWKLVGKKSVPLVNVQTPFQTTFTGNGSPVGVIFPQVAVAFYVQQDSDPTGILWSWYNNSWVH